MSRSVCWRLHGWVLVLLAASGAGAANWLDGGVQTTDPAPVGVVGRSGQDNVQAQGGIGFLKNRGERGGFLPVEQAFSVQSHQDNNQLVLSFAVTPGHYLYQQRMAVSAGVGVEVGKPQFDQAPTTVDDPDFGRVPVFERSVVLRVPVQGSGVVDYRWQGCAKAGLCYPPQKGQVKVSGAPAVARAVTPAVQPDYAAMSVPREAMSVPSLITALGKPGPDVQIIALPSGQGGRTLSPRPLNPADLEVFDWPYPPELPHAPRSGWPWGDWLAPSGSIGLETPANDPLAGAPADPFGLAQHPLSALALLFLAGLGLAFTPCVLPMLPIVSQLVARQHRRSSLHGLLLSGAYAVGVASSYALLGALVAVFGQRFNLMGWLQQPAVLLAFAGLFVLLALASVGVLPLRLPAVIGAWVGRIGQQGQHERWSGHVLGCAVAGFFSALVVSPCVSAPLAGVLLSVATVGDPWLGAAALFVLGLGLSAPLVVLGASEGRLLPQAGPWLEWIRQGFGLMLLGVALVLVGRVWLQPGMLVLWSGLFLVLAGWLWRWQGQAVWVTRALATMGAVWAVLLLVGAAMGATDPWRPLAPLPGIWSKQPDALAVEAAVPVIHRIDELERLQAQHPNLLVDVTADWCVSCRIMERELFGRDRLPALAGWVRVKLDVTAFNADSQQALERLGLFGPPALLFYANGQRVHELVGETHRAQLEAALQRLETRR